MSSGGKRKIRLLLSDGVVVFGLILFVLWTLAPIAWMLISSVLPQRALTSKPPDVSPSLMSLDNYRKVIDDKTGLADAFIDSTIIALSTTAVALILGATAAFALARLRVPGGDRIMLFVLATQMFPPIVLIIPLFIVMSRIGLIDTHLGLMVVYLSFVLPIVIWVLKGFFEGIPRELERAAAVDGASTFQTFRLVVLPISLPPLFAAGVFAFIESWNEFFFAVILTRTDVKTVPIMISQFSGQYQQAYGQMLAAATLASVPVVIAAIIFRKYILLGFAEGAVKG